MYWESDHDSHNMEQDDVITWTFIYPTFLYNMQWNAINQRKCIYTAVFQLEVKPHLQYRTNGDADSPTAWIMGPSRMPLMMWPCPPAPASLAAFSGTDAEKLAELPWANRSVCSDSTIDVSSSTINYNQLSNQLSGFLHRSSSRWTRKPNVITRIPLDAQLMSDQPHPQDKHYSRKSSTTVVQNYNSVRKGKLRLLWHLPSAVGFPTYCIPPSFALWQSPGIWAWSPFLDQTKRETTHVLSGQLD